MLTISDPKTSARTPVNRFARDVTGIDEDRRGADRESDEVRIVLSALGWSDPQACTTKDLSEGGLYVQLPVTCGLSVGQRCEVGFVGHEDAAKPSTIAGEIRYATVVRTDTVAPPAAHQIGAGLRFDQPLFL